MKPVVIHRFTVTPSPFFSTKFLSRSSFIRRAMRSRAWSQETGSNLSEPGLRTFGRVRRVSDFTVCSSAAPFGQSVPRLVGWSTSPSIWMISAFSPLERSPRA